jgi:hypothetical protein
MRIAPRGGWERQPQGKARAVLDGTPREARFHKFTERGRYRNDVQKNHTAIIDTHLTSKCTPRVKGVGARVGIVSLCQRAPRAGGPQRWEIGGGVRGTGVTARQNARFVEHKKPLKRTPHLITSHSSPTSVAAGTPRRPTATRCSTATMILRQAGWGWTRPSGRKYAWMIHSRWACVFAVSHGRRGNDASRGELLQTFRMEKFPTFCTSPPRRSLERTSTDKSTRVPTA